MRGTNRKGITLIALCITIVVLLIIASVSITALTSEKSTIKKANEQADNAEEQSLIEKIRADIYTEKTAKNRILTNEEIKAIISKYATINYDIDGTTIKSITPKNKDYEIPIGDVIVNNI